MALADDAITGDAELVHYLASHALLEPDAAPDVTELSDGVSAHVVRIGDLVCKQPYRQLRVASRWDADPGRVIAEGEALGRFGGIAPELVHLDPVRHLLVQRHVPGVNWKQLLLRGELHPETAAAVGAQLAIIHTADSGWVDGADRLQELRIAPYFEHAARARPDLAPALDEVVAHLRRERHAVVHGDFSPKNILVSPSDPARTTIIDWEVVHAGSPVFDLAFLVCHLRAKAVHLPALRDGFAELEEAFWAGYARDIDAEWFSRLLGAFLVARVHGRSPLAYLDGPARSALLDEGYRLLHTEQRTPTP